MRAYLIFIFIILGYIKSNSQAIVYKDQGAWFSLSHNFRLTKLLLLTNVTQLRTVDFLKHQQAVIIEQGLCFKLNNNLSISGGYLLFTSYPNGKLHTPIKKYENRIWQNLIINSAIGNVKLNQRFIFEQRFKDAIILNSNNEYEIEGVTYSQRIRYKLEATTSLIRLKNNTNIYGKLSNETRIKFESGLKEPDFDQNNFAALIGSQFLNNSKIWIGYGYNYFKLSSTKYISNSILNISFCHDIDLTKKI